MNRIDEAFKKIQRVNFLPGDVSSYAGEDRPLPIGYGQTNSQPSTVRMMLQWLDVKPGQKVLDVGYGSGWTTALLSHLIGRKGMVYAVERMPQLVKMGRQNCLDYGVKNAHFHQAGSEFGWQRNAPYERILVSASAQSLPESLVSQLASGGRMVVPVGSRILIVDKDKSGSISITEHPGFAFVPLL